MLFKQIPFLGFNYCVDESFLSRQKKVQMPLKSICTKLFYR